MFTYRKDIKKQIENKRKTVNKLRSDRAQRSPAVSISLVGINFQ